MDPIATLLASQTRDARQRRVFGIVTAIVRRVEDGGRYFLEYLTMTDGTQDSAPARVMMPMTGQNRGVHFFPEVGDEVVVAFENGDTNLPVILGGVWNADSLPPEQAQQSAANDRRTIVSRSGHELTFDDSRGAEQVAIRTQGGHEVVLDDTPGSGGVTVTSAGGHTVTLDDTPPGSVEVATAGGCRITASDAGGQLTVEAPTILTLKSQMIRLEATSIMMQTTGSLTASMVLVEGRPFGTHMHTSSPVNPSGPVVG